MADRLPADPEAPTDEWVAGINAAGWDFHRQLQGNAVSSPVSIGTAFSLSRAGASGESGPALDEIFGFPDVDLHSAANAVDLSLAEASVGAQHRGGGQPPLPRRRVLTADTEFLRTAAAHYGAAPSSRSTPPTVRPRPGSSTDGCRRAPAGSSPQSSTADVVQDQQLVLVNTVYLKARLGRSRSCPSSPADGQFTTDDVTSR